MRTQTHSYNAIQSHAHIHTHNTRTQMLKQIHTFKHTFTHIIINTHIHVRAYFLVFENTQTYTCAH